MIAILVLVCVCFIFYNRRQKPIIWMYWETAPGKIKPQYIDLCYETVLHHCNQSFDIKLLNENTIKDYLPDVRDLSHLTIPAKTDYYRIALLYKYGGIWIDADTIVMRDLKPIVDKLNTEVVDFIGFGCTGMKCTNGYPRPSNWLMCAKKDSPLMENCLKHLDHLLENKSIFGYFDLGKYVIWKEIEKLKKTGWDYYHYSSEYDGSRDINGNWIHTPQHIKPAETIPLDREKVFVMFLANRELSTIPALVKSTKKELLTSKMWISKLFREALNIK